MAFRGPRVTSSTGVWHVVDDDSLNQRGVAGTVYDAFPNDGWVTRIEAFCRRETGGSSTGLYYAIWLEGAGGAPTERLGRTGFVTPTSSSAGSTLGANVVAADAAFSPSSTALAVRNGTRPVVGFRSENGDIGFAVVGTNQATHYQRTVSSGYPTDPFTAASNQLRPTIALWIVYTENTAPTTPTNTPMPGMPAAPQEPSGFWNS